MLMKSSRTCGLALCPPPISSMHWLLPISGASVSFWINGFYFCCRPCVPGAVRWPWPDTRIPQMWKSQWVTLDLDVHLWHWHLHQIPSPFCKALCHSTRLSGEGGGLTSSRRPAAEWRAWAPWTSCSWLSLNFMRTSKTDRTWILIDRDKMFHREVAIQMPELGRQKHCAPEEEVSGGLYSEDKTLSYLYCSSFVFNIQEFDKVLQSNHLIIPVLPHKIIISRLKKLNMSLLEDSHIKLSL